MADELDRRFMAAAIRLGASANGTTAPSPAVGAIVVKNGVVIGRGRTAEGGRPHAEPQALEMAGEAARGATLYVSLEPCAHQGRGGPCADAIIAAGVSRVVAAITDPNPKVSGGGFERLRAAGIEVASGILAEEAGRVHAGHFRRVEMPMPYVTLKLAVSADDAIGRAGEPQVAVTGDVARRYSQALRTRFDSILVGRGTIEVDDPELTVRLPGLENRSPIRIVLDSGGQVKAEQRVFDASAATWILVADDGRSGDTGRRSGIRDEGGAPHPKSALLRQPDFDLPSGGRFGAASASDDIRRPRRLLVTRSSGGLDLSAALRRLAEEGIARLLIEGGAKVARSFLEAELVDEVMLFRSPRTLGGDIVPALAGLPLSTIEASPRFRRIERRRFGVDTLTRYERAR